MLLYPDFGKILRWGNYGMVYMNLLAIAKDSGHEIKLPPYFAWQYFETPPEIDNCEKPDLQFNFRQIHQSDEQYNEIVHFFRQNQDKKISITMGPHMQSELWHTRHKEYVMERMKLKQDCVEAVRSKYSDALSKPTIGIGIRRGDFVNHECFFQIPWSWQMDAVRHIWPNYQDQNIIVLSDNIDECRAHFQQPNVYFAEPNTTHKVNSSDYNKDPFDHFILGSLCDHFVAGQSTFHWLIMWYVHNYKAGTVVHSNRNHTLRAQREAWNPDYYPISWTKYEGSLEQVGFPYSGKITNLLRAHPRTDKEKEGGHSYGPIQDLQLKPEMCKIGEIGVFEGGSIDVWSECFPNAEIVALDINPQPKSWPANVKFFQANAYDNSFVQKTFQNDSFDCFIDDGPHTYESMIQFCKLYKSVVRKGGFLIIEDIPVFQWIDDFKKLLPNFNVLSYDMRFARKVEGKDRWDNIMMVAQRKF